MATTKTELVEIKPIEMKTMEIEIIGDTPLIMHAWSEKAKRMMLETQQGKAKGKKKPVRNPVDDFIQSLYWLTEKPVYKEDASEEECKKACEMACADEFISRMPEGYNTHIEQGGNNVSGGQKQRLCIARALLKSPKILILDDSTSAVDTATDAKIRKAFREEIPGVTKFIIAQRISSISDADRIIVLENGRINGIGTHEELLKNNEIYREVYESQTGGAGDFDETEVD